MGQEAAIHTADGREGDTDEIRVFVNPADETKYFDTLDEAMDWIRERWGEEIHTFMFTDYKSDWDGTCNQLHSWNDDELPSTEQLTLEE